MRSRLAAAAVAAAAALFAAPPAGADPLPPSPAIAPGVGVARYDAADQFAGTCTLGFLATGEDGTHYAFTAGHCASGGDAVMVYKTAGNYLRVGQFAQSVNDTGRFGQDDIAIVRLEANTPQDTRVLSRRPVEGVAPMVAVGDTLCFYGVASGLRCGPVAPTSPNPLSMVAFKAVSEHGDSGAPVYLIGADGLATAVGILQGHSDDGTVVATLIEPYLDKWNLTLDTTKTPAAVKPVSVHTG